MHASPAPWVCLTIYECKTRIADVEAAVLVDRLDIRILAADIEGQLADQSRIWNVEKPRD
jgi:hypothetical protein